MTEWHTIPAKFTSDEKRILDKLHDKYDLNHNQSLKAGLELFARFLAMTEFYVTIDSKTIKKIRRIVKKYNKMMETEIEEVLKTIPTKDQETQSKELSTGITKIWSQADNIFVKNRKRGRKSIKRKRGRPKDTGKAS
jgi:hypothetical protein